MYMGMDSFNRSFPFLVTYITDFVIKAVYFRDMKFYEILAKEYTALFPSSIEKVNFVKTMLSQTGPRHLLDIGCASGEFIFQLTSFFDQLTGIDLDEHMIKVAANKMDSESYKSISLHQTEMLSFLSASPSEVYDSITCMGNTIAYLKNNDELAVYLSDAFAALKPNGKLILQILNYANPMIGPGFSFPVAEGPTLLLKRSYLEAKEHSKYDFHTHIINKESNKLYKDSHTHTPFLSSYIQNMAHDAGFSQTNTFGNYNKKKADTDDFFHLIVLEK